MRLSKIFISISLSIFSFMLTAQSIHRVACEGNLNKLDSLLKTTDVDLKNSTESTALHAAVYCRQDAAFDLLINMGASIDLKNKFGETPFFYSTTVGNIRMAKVLLNKGANINVIGNGNRTPLLNAVQAGNLEIFKLLIEAGADINIGLSPLHSAVINGNLEMVKDLINEETDVDVLNDYGNTPLAIAVRQNDQEIIKYLIDKGADAQKIPDFQLKGEYLGQPSPGMTASVFAKNFVSTEDFNHTPAISSDGNEFYYTLESRRYNGGTIMVSKQKNGVWSKPEPADIEGEYREIDPFITSDGSRLFYCSDRPQSKSDTISRNIDMWMVEREGDGWSEPIHLGDIVNTPDFDWFPTISDKGNLFFSTGPGRASNIVYSEFKNGEYQSAKVLNDSINSESRDYDPFIAPDESYIIFSSNRPGGYGSVDLYISFKSEDGSWTKAKNMGERINSNIIEFAPKVSPDGKYLFFNRGGDIFWISAEIIDTLRG